MITDEGELENKNYGICGKYYYMTGCPQIQARYIHSRFYKKQSRIKRTVKIGTGNCGFQTLLESLSECLKTRDARSYAQRFWLNLNI